MYAMQLEALELREGLTFLDLGCGSGWATTMVGLLVGEVPIIILDCELTF
jgi:protein-L-isoaspartate O-methyltransferase